MEAMRRNLDEFFPLTKNVSENYNFLILQNLFQFLRLLKTHIKDGKCFSVMSQKLN